MIWRFDNQLQVLTEKYANEEETMIMEWWA
jgi:hypothetical protein